jgi:hypothetical protein
MGAGASDPALLAFLERRNAPIQPIESRIMFALGHVTILELRLQGFSTRLLFQVIVTSMVGLSDPEATWFVPNPGCRTT